MTILKPKEHEKKESKLKEAKEKLAKKMKKKYQSPDKGDRSPGMEGSGKFGSKKVMGGYYEYLEQ